MTFKINEELLVLLLVLLLAWLQLDPETLWYSWSATLAESYSLATGSGDLWYQSGTTGLVATCIFHAESWQNDRTLTFGRKTKVTIATSRVDPKISKRSKWESNWKNLHGRPKQMKWKWETGWWDRKKRSKVYLKWAGLLQLLLLHCLRVQGLLSHVGSQGNVKCVCRIAAAVASAKFDCLSSQSTSDFILKYKKNRKNNKRLVSVEASKQSMTPSHNVA